MSLHTDWPVDSEPSRSDLVSNEGAHRRWRIGLLLGIGVLVNYFDRVNISVSHGALVQEFHISEITFGVLASAYSWTYAVLQIPVGVILDRIGVQVVGRVSAVIWSAASLCAAFAPGVTTFLGARLLLGVGEAPTFPANSKATGYWFPENERSFATSLFDAAAKLASAIGVPMLGLVLIYFGWRATFAFTGVLSFGFFLAFWRVYRNPSRDRTLSSQELEYILRGNAQPENAAGERTKGAPLVYLLRKREVMGATIGFAAYNWTFYLLLTWLPAYLTVRLHVDLLHSVLYTSVPWGVATLTDLCIGGLLVDWLVSHGWTAWKVRQTVLVLGMLCGVCIYGAGVADTPGQVLLWTSLSLGGLGAMAPVGWSVPSLIAPKESVGRIGGIMNFATQLAAIAAPIVTGYFAGKHDFPAAFTVAAIILCAGIAVYVFLLGRMQATPEPNLELSPGSIS
jgi:MFS transporter, ACS family, D-galactonate transporter